MNAVLLYGTPNSRFHFGELGLEDRMSLSRSSSFFHSDTLLSALLNIAERVDESFSRQLVEEVDNNTFQISSGFPFMEIHGTAPIFFLPKPLVRSMDADGDDFKKAKKIKFISAAVWEEGLTVQDWFNASKCTILQNRFVCTKEELQKRFAEAYQNMGRTTDYGLEKCRRLNKYLQHSNMDDSPHVKAHTNLDDNNRLYNLTYLRLADNALDELEVKNGFYFLYQLAETAIHLTDSKLDVLFSLLPKTGIGGERSTGCGLFDSFAKQKFTIATENTEHWVNLSLLIPQNLTAGNIVAYDLAVRGGRILGQSAEYLPPEKPTEEYDPEQHVRLQQVRTIVEGSCFLEQIPGKLERIGRRNADSDYVLNGTSLFLPYSNLAKNE